MRGMTPNARDSVNGGRAAHAGGRAAGLATVVVATLVLAQGCADVAGDPAPLAEGRALYQANCLTCHGDDARGGGPLARTLPVEPPSILEHLGHHNHAQLVQMIRGGIPPAMPPTALSEEEVGQILDYVWTLVPDSEVAELRAVQQQMEATGGAPVGSAAPGMPGMDHSQHMQAPTPEADHSEHMRESTPEVDHSQHGTDHSEHAPGTTSMGDTEVQPLWVPGRTGRHGGRTVVARHPGPAPDSPDTPARGAAAAARPHASWTLSPTETSR
jgi:mono/diheme cytochrome c family protein